MNVSEPLIDQLLDSGMEKLEDDTLAQQRGKDRVFLNGDWVGVCKDSLSLVTVLRSKRRRKEVPPQVASNFLLALYCLVRLESALHFGSLVFLVVFVDESNISKHVS